MISATGQSTALVLWRPAEPYFLPRPKPSTSVEAVSEDDILDLRCLSISYPPIIPRSLPDHLFRAIVAAQIATMPFKLDGLVPRYRSPPPPDMGSSENGDMASIDEDWSLHTDSYPHSQFSGNGHEGGQSAPHDYSNAGVSVTGDHEMHMEEVQPHPSTSEVSSPLLPVPSIANVYLTPQRVVNTTQSLGPPVTPQRTATSSLAVPSTSGHSEPHLSTPLSSPTVISMDQLFLKRKVDYDAPEYDVFMDAPIGNDHFDAKRQKVIPSESDRHVPQDAEPSEELEREEEDRREQWKVGALPGHQGSHVKYLGALGSEGRKRTLSQGTGELVERVLKKPFKPPAKIVLPQILSKRRQDHTEPHSPTRHANAHTAAILTKRFPLYGLNPSNVDYDPIQSDPQREEHQQQQQYLPQASNAGDADHLTLSPSLKTKTKNSAAAAASRAQVSKAKLSKPFKSPISQSVRSNRPGPQANSANEIAALEKQALTLRSAVRYASQPEEDDRLVSLIQIWRQAGREVVEQLFDLIPEPDSSTYINDPTSKAIQGWGYENDDHSFPRESILTEEQRVFLRNAPTNRDGDPVDHEGNLLLPPPEDVWSILADVPKTYGREAKYQSASRSNRDTDGSSPRQVPEPEGEEWTMGTMMKRLQVDPALLGWDEAAQDWSRVNDHDDGGLWSEGT